MRRNPRIEVHIDETTGYHLREHDGNFYLGLCKSKSQPACVSLIFTHPDAFDIFLKEANKLRKQFGGRKKMRMAPRSKEKDE
jgi:hypothetical protein